MAEDPKGASPASRPTCATCPWFDPYYTDKGTCHFESPYPKLEQSADGNASIHAGDGLWPEVHKNDWCRNHPERTREHLDLLFGPPVQELQAEIPEAALQVSARAARIAALVGEGVVTWGDQRPAAALVDRHPKDFFVVVTLPTEKAARSLAVEFRELETLRSTWGRKEPPAGEADEG